MAKPRKRVKRKPRVILLIRNFYRLSQGTRAKQ